MDLKTEEEVKRSKKTNLPEPIVEIDKEKMCMHITYEPQTSRVSFSVSDIYGSIICTGDLSSGKAVCDGKEKNIQPGTYNLMVIDGEDVIRQQIVLG